MRKPKTNRVPRTRAGGEWTEAAFWGFLRSNVRRASMRWPPLARLALDAAKRPSQSSNKRLKWEFQCAECGEWYPRKQVHVDHLHPCGPMKTWPEFAQFCERLFCEADHLQILCIEKCHQQKTNSKTD